MNTSSDPPERQLDSALLLLSREARVLADLLRHCLPEAQIDAWAKAVGRRKAGRPDPALQLAEAISVHQKIRGQVALALHEALPDAGTEGAWSDIAGLLRSAELNDWETALERMSATDWSWPEALPSTVEEAASGSDSNAPQLLIQAESGPADPEAPRLARLQEQLKASRQEAASLQEQLGTERRKRLADEAERSQAFADAEAQRLRATELKHQLARSNEASEREAQLDAELKELRHRLHVVSQKVAWLEDERDDLRGVLADHDRFDAIAEEEVPSFRDRPLTQPEQEITQRLESRRKAGFPSFRVLVVGGGQPQHRHQDKLLEYAESMGFHAHWRMAEYQAWHRAMDGLQRDMQERYDALVILHWNRTTFTRKAREICDRGGAKPCLTCHYEGFTNLRESLQECLRELLAAADRASSK